jgi:hypothetical protein
VKAIILVVLGLVILVMATSCEVRVWTSSTAAPDPGPAGGGSMPSAAVPGAADERASAQESWIGRVNAECARRNAQARRLARPRTLDDLAVYADRILEIYRRANGRIASVPAPRRYRGRMQRLERLAEQTEAGLDALAAAARRGDSTAAIARAREVQAVARRASATFTSLGLTECRTSSGGPF